MSSVTVSATEWAASESIALEPLTRPATALAAAIPKFAAAATSTVKVLSPDSGAPEPPASAASSVCSVRSARPGSRSLVMRRR